MEKAAPEANNNKDNKTKIEESLQETQVKKDSFLKRKLLKIILISFLKKKRVTSTKSLI